MRLVHHKISTEHYHKMIDAGILTEKDKVELIKGEIIDMSPIGKVHNAIVDRMANLLKEIAQQQVIIRTQGSIHLPPESEPEPDIVLLKPRADFYAAELPQPADVFLVIEVAKSSWEYDYEVKRPLYAEAGIPELWLVNLNKHEMEVHRAPQNGTYKEISIKQLGDMVKLPVPDCDTAIRMEDLIGPKPTSSL